MREELLSSFLRKAKGSPHIEEAAQRAMRERGIYKTQGGFLFWRCTDDCDHDSCLRFSVYVGQEVVVKCEVWSSSVPGTASLEAIRLTWGLTV